MARHNSPARIQKRTSGLTTMPSARRALSFGTRQDRWAIWPLLWMTDNRLSLQQPGGRIADKRLGVAAINPQHFERLVAGLIADFEQGYGALDGGRHEPGPQRMPWRRPSR